MKIQDKFKESKVNSNLNCTKSELDEYLAYGLLLKQNNKYYDRELNEINIVQPSALNINLQNILITGINISKSSYKKRVYCMTEKLYNKYKEMGYIINKEQKEYFRVYNNEEWLINIIK